MLTAEVEILDGVAPTLDALERAHTLMVITKGDLLEQESKLARSGIADYFSHVEVVSKKTTQVYARLLAAYRLDAASFMMVGNSLKSDVLPVLELGAYGVHVPYAVTWAHEVVDVPPEELPHYDELADLSELPDLVARVEQRGRP
jgi:putative hydrolase of the HAD superfamily